MYITRRKTRQIKVGKVKIGGDAPISVQSMTTTDTRDVKTTVEQICQLEQAGCEIIRVAVEHAAGKNPRPVNYDRIPSCTYCQPEVASIGLTGEEARRRGHEVAVGSFPFAAIGKAKILDETRGFVRIVAERKYDQILGVHVIGPHATELISEATAALSLEATAESILEAVHAHPTLSEAMGEAALAVHGRSIHI